MSVAHTPLYRHPAPHRELLRRYRYYAARQEFRLSVLFSLLTFAASLVASFYAVGYATESASNPVTDIILSNTPVFDVDGLFVYGTFLFVGFGTVLLVAHPKRIPFTLHALALFYFLRAGFISLTHLGPFPIHTENTFDFGMIAGRIFSGGDLFFSGHVGLSFLLALIFWREKNTRNTFLAASLFFSVIVLLGHLHYSIDVVSAYFITYTIFCIALRLFPKDRTLFFSDPPAESLSV